nr:roundabout homolog 3-like [Penaeus vannamei]
MFDSLKVWVLRYKKSYMLRGVRTLPAGHERGVGPSARIACRRRRGHAPPDLGWTRNGHPIDLKEEAERVQVREDGTLVIQEVLQTDEGEYVCEASNPAGTRKSPPAILDVIVAPFWVKGARDVVGVAGKEVEISCRVGGDPRLHHLAQGGRPHPAGPHAGGARPRPQGVAAAARRRRRLPVQGGQPRRRHHRQRHAHRAQ